MDFIVKIMQFPFSMSYHYWGEVQKLLDTLKKVK